MEGADDSDKIVGPHIGPVEGCDTGDVSTRQLDDGDEVTSMATPTLDERDGMSGPGKKQWSKIQSIHHQIICFSAKYKLYGEDILHKHTPELHVSHYYTTYVF